MELKKGYFIRFRSFSHFFKSDWYYNRLKLIRKHNKNAYKDYSMLIDIGAITIGKRKEQL